MTRVSIIENYCPIRKINRWVSLMGQSNGSWVSEVDPVVGFSQVGQSGGSAESVEFQIIVQITFMIFRAIFDLSNKIALLILRRMYALYVKKKAKV